MKLTFVLLSCLSLGGCWFIYIPSSLFAAGNTCVGKNAYVGQRITNGQSGKTGTLKEIIGRSDRCQKDELPVLAAIEYD